MDTVPCADMLDCHDLIMMTMIPRAFSYKSATCPLICAAVSTSRELDYTCGRLSEARGATARKPPAARARARYLQRVSRWT